MFLAFAKFTYRSCFSGILLLLGFSFSFPRLWISADDFRLRKPCLSSLLRFLTATFTIGCRHCRLVGSSGVEPPTSCLSGMRSNLLSYEPLLLAQPGLTFDLRFKSLWTTFGFSTDGGDEGIRTLDPLLAGQVLSQLSYTPIMGMTNGHWKSNNNF